MVNDVGSTVAVNDPVKKPLVPMDDSAETHILSSSPSQIGQKINFIQASNRCSDHGDVYQSHQLQDVNDINNSLIEVKQLHPKTPDINKQTSKKCFRDINETMGGSGIDHYPREGTPLPSGLTSPGSSSASSRYSYDSISSSLPMITKLEEESTNDFLNDYVVVTSPEISYRFVPYLQTFSAKLVLEVFGGSGAIWGFSEAITIRDSSTEEFWRFWAALGGAIFFIRFLLQSKDYINHMEEIKTNSRLRCVQIFTPKLILEVWGGVGAVWGFSEVLTIRNSSTVWFWRPASLAVGVIFFCRWILHLIDYYKYEVKGSEKRNQSRPQESSMHKYQIFSAKLVLQVFGGAGAIWGFSEVVTLRNTYTCWIWRQVALGFGFVFLVRWVMQIRDYNKVRAKYDDGYQVGSPDTLKTHYDGYQVDSPDDIEDPRETIRLKLFIDDGNDSH